nr:uncharacterized protein LOC133624531 isoform X2 [Nerophis lumbriciformis]
MSSKIQCGALVLVLGSCILTHVAPTDSTNAFCKIVCWARSLIHANHTSAVGQVGSVNFTLSSTAVGLGCRVDGASMSAFWSSLFDNGTNYCNLRNIIQAITASTLLGRLSTRLRSVFIGIFHHSSKSALVRSHTDVGREVLALSLRSNSSQRCSIGFRSGLCAGQSSSSTPDSVIHVFMDLALCTGAQSCWKKKGPAPNCSHKVGSMELSKMF